MKEVVVEHVGSSKVRIIQVGIGWSKTKTTRKESSKGIVCSPRILVRATSWDCSFSTGHGCWKTTKHGRPHAKKNWQRHPNRKPSIRRARWGHFRKHIHPGARILNELGLCIYPDVTTL